MVNIKNVYSSKNSAEWLQVIGRPKLDKNVWFYKKHYEVHYIRTCDSCSHKHMESTKNAYMWGIYFNTFSKHGEYINNLWLCVYEQKKVLLWLNIVCINVVRLIIECTSDEWWSYISLPSCWDKQCYCCGHINIRLIIVKQVWSLPLFLKLATGYL